jgi:hypothetical protein
MAESHLQLAIISKSLLQTQGITKHRSQNQQHGIQSKLKNRGVLCRNNHLDVRHFDNRFTAPLRNYSPSHHKLSSNILCNRRNSNGCVAAAALPAVEAAMLQP